MKLCWKCKEQLLSPSELGSDVEICDELINKNFVHCHHSEPEEKPKCWCEYPLNKRYQNFGIIGGSWPDELLISEPKLKFCPICGKKLERKEEISEI